ncbi:MAG: efflux RND transporter permease subunit [Nannocystaceae bacterium]
MLPLLIKFCIQRRFAAVMVTLLVAAFGAYAYTQTPVEAYPDVTNVQVEIVAQVPGLAPEEMERQVTIPLERALNGNPGMMQMRSESGFRLTIIWCVFEDGTDSFRARTQTSERLLTAEVPENAFVRLTPDATPLGKIFYYRLVSDRHDLYELRSAQEWTVSRILKQVHGVADAMGMGGFLKEFHIEVDPAKLASYGLTLHDVAHAVEHSNLNVGGGFQRRGDQQLMIRGVGYLTSPQDVKDIVLEVESGTPVTVGDVARVVQSYTPRQGSVGYNEEREIVEGIVLLRRGENPDEVLEDIHAKVAELNERILPAGMRIEVMYDRSDLTGLTLETVNENLLHGFLLIVGVVWLFLRTIRGSLVVASVIPLALLTAFAGLYLIDLPANLISMGAIDFGILVDGAVVLVESSIHEARESRPTTSREMLGLIGRSAMRVARPTFYAMAVIIAALIPVFTLESVEGRIFRPLALTYSFALVGALAFSMTVVPALCAIFLRPKDAQTKDPKSLLLLREGYSRTIGWMLRGKQAVGLVIGVGLFVAAVWTAPRVGTEFLPELDEGDIFIVIEMPPSIALDRGQDVLAEVRRRLMEFPEVLSTPSEQGRPEDGLDNETTNMSETFARLRPREQWRPGYDHRAAGRGDARIAGLILGVKFNFSQPIKRPRRGGRQRCAARRAQGLRHRPQADARDAAGGQGRGRRHRGCRRPRPVPRRDRAAAADPARSSRARARGHHRRRRRRGGRDRHGRQGRHDHVGGERLVPLRVKLPSSEKADLTRIGELMRPDRRGRRVGLRELGWPTSRCKTGASRSCARATAATSR